MAVGRLSMRWRLWRGCLVAGASQHALASETTDEVAEALLDINALAPIRLTQAVLPLMLKRWVLQRRWLCPLLPAHLLRWQHQAGCGYSPCVCLPACLAAVGHPPCSADTSMLTPPRVWPALPVSQAPVLCSAVSYVLCLSCPVLCCPLLYCPVQGQRPHGGCVQHGSQGALARPGRVLSSQDGSVGLLCVACHRAGRQVSALCWTVPVPMSQSAHRW